MSVLVADQRVLSLRDRVLNKTSLNGKSLGWLASGDEKYGEAFWIAEDKKLDLRAWYETACPVIRDEPFEVMLRRSDEFWGEYEDINRLWLPVDPVYSGTRTGITLATTADAWTLSAAAAGQDRVLESFVGGEATVSTVVRVAVQLSTGGATPTNQTPEKFNTRSPAAASTFAITWTTQPTLSGVAALFHAFNAFGGTDRWVPQPGAEIYLVNAEKVSARSQAGIPVVSTHVIWEEL